MSFHENKLSVTQTRIKNTSGTKYVQGTLVLEQGFFGNVVAPEGIADGAYGIIDIDSAREIETDQIKTTETFAVSANTVEAGVYFNITDKLLYDDDGTKTHPKVGALVYGGAKDSNNVIRFKPYAQIVYPDAVV